MKKLSDEATIIKRMRCAHKWSVLLIICACAILVAFFVRWIWLRDIEPIGCAFVASSSLCVTIAAHLDNYIEKNRDPLYNGMFGWMRNVCMVDTVFLAFLVLIAFFHA